MTRHDVDALREKLAGRRVVASISGGKDSAAMSLYLREIGIEHDRVFMDTGWEHALTYEYLRGELTRVIGPITEIGNALKMEELVLKRGMFPSKRRRFCTQELKVFPMQRHLASLDYEPVNAVGIRAGESEARAKMSEWEMSRGFDCETWRPLITWSEQDVIDMHHRHGLAPNPLYLMGASRVGCWPCIYARKSEIRLVAAKDPGRIDLIRALEEQVAARAGERYAKKGETFESLGYQKPSWFQAPLGDTGDCWPIDKVVDWSKTSHGGRQVELFDATPGDAGCMRWGLCETNPPDEDAA